MDKIYLIFPATFFGVIAAIILHSSLLFVLLFGKMDRPTTKYYKSPVEEEMEVEVVDEQENQRQIEEEIAADESAIVKNVATDVNDSRESSSTDYSSSLENPNLENDVWKEVLAYEEELMTKEKENRDDRSYNIPDQESHDYKEYTESALLDDGTTKPDAKGMAELDLNSPRRYSRTGTLKIPGYVGHRGGTIVVIIVVDQIGEVVSSRIDESRTTVTEEYALSKALEFSKRERFNRTTDAPKKQSGTITYTYVSQ